MLTVPIDLEIILNGGRLAPLDASYLSYDPGNPYAVTLITAGEDQPRVTWGFARDLLHDGLFCPGGAGRGDIEIWACRPRELHFALHSPDGAIDLVAPRGQAEKFLALAYAMVPLGHEMDGVDMDGIISSILGEAA